MKRISKSISRIIVTGSVQCRFVAVSCFGLVLCFFDQAGCIILGVNIKLICLSICFGWVRVRARAPAVQYFRSSFHLRLFLWFWPQHCGTVEGRRKKHP